MKYSTRRRTKKGKPNVKGRNFKQNCGKTSWLDPLSVCIHYACMSGSFKPAVFMMFVMKFITLPICCDVYIFAEEQA